MVDFCSYLRVSTDKQGITGLGMDAEREAVSRYVQNRGHIVAEFIEVESGKNHTNRPQLLAALAECRPAADEQRSSAGRARDRGAAASHGGFSGGPTETLKVAACDV